MIFNREHIDGIHCSGVLSGTYIELKDDLSLENLAKLDQEQFDLLLNRLSVFFTGLPFSEAIQKSAKQGKEQ